LILESANRSKTTWNIVKTVTNKRTCTNNKSPILINNITTNNPSSIADAFNTYFSSVAENLISDLSLKKDTSIVKDHTFYLRLNCTQSFPSLRLYNTTTHEINKIIQSLKSKDSHGYDEGSSRILKISAPFILSPLCYIFNKVLVTGTFPDRLKFSENKTLFKLNLPTTVQSLCYFPFLKLLNNLFM